MAKNRGGKGTTNLFFSKEHTSKQNPKPHTDSYRQSGGNKATKTGHNPSPTHNIPVKVTRTKSG